MKDGTLCVGGVGRVGSYAAAVQAKRSRARRYWAIFRFTNACSPRCRGTGDNHLHYPIGLVEATDHPKFKTKTAADQYLQEIVGKSGST